MNKLCADDIQWKYKEHLTFTDHSHYVDRDERFKIQKETITNRDGHGWVGSSKVYFFIDHCPVQFSNIGDMVKVWNELNDYDKATTEVKWIKVIKQKQ